jgi:hypothetical protein
MTIVQEFFAQNAILTRVGSELGSGLLVTVVDSKDARPLRPRVVFCPIVGRTVQ